MQTRGRMSSLVTILAICVVSLSYLGCAMLPQPIPTPIRTVPVSSEKADNLVSKLGEELVLDAEGQFVVTITEEELTSYVALNMGQTITDPQIILSDGKIHLHGTIAMPVRTTITAILLLEEVAGQAKTTVESISLGGLAIPDSLADSLIQQMDNLITPQHSRGDVQITEIEMLEGELTIRGRVVS